MKLLNIDHLSRGTERQKQAYAAIQNFRLFELLEAYTPVLAGTIPLDIDTPTSDLDIICSAPNLESFAALIRTHFESQQGFELHHKTVGGQPTVLVRFRAHGFAFEIFAQPSSVFAQPAVLHMLIEARLLTFAPKEAKEKIRTLKAAGISTEAAFAECFEIEGDPHEELLKIARLPDHEILKITHRFRFPLR